MSPVAVPNIPRLPASTQREVRQAFDALRSWFKGIQQTGFGTGTTTIVETGGGDTDGNVIEPDPTIPPQVTGLVVSSGFASILLTWNDVGMDTAYVAVYRAPANDFGQAVQVGTTYSRQYSDTPPTQKLADTYYYWVRAISMWGVEGPLNATSGTPGSTQDSPEYVFDLLASSKWSPNTAYTSGQRIYPSRPNGFAYLCTSGGVSGIVEPTWPIEIDGTVSDGACSWKCEIELSFEALFDIGLVNGVVKAVIRSLLIGDATITNAKIQSLSADKLTVPGVASIWDAIITNGVITNAFIGNTIQSNDFVAGSTGWQINKDGSAQFCGQVVLSSDDGKTRLEGNSINVYDDANQLRVKIGKLTE